MAMNHSSTSEGCGSVIVGQSKIAPGMDPIKTTTP